MKGNIKNHEQKEIIETLRQLRMHFRLFATGKTRVVHLLLKMRSKGYYEVELGECLLSGLSRRYQGLVATSVPHLSFGHSNGLDAKFEPSFHVCPKSDQLRISILHLGVPLGLMKQRYPCPSSRLGPQRFYSAGAAFSALAAATRASHSSHVIARPG
jgi:hypothetical protein